MRMLILVCATLVLAPAAAQEANDRYRMTPTPDGFLRLDSRTGAVSECKRGADGYQCRLVPDEQAALDKEIDRLATENAELKERLGVAAPEKRERSARPDQRNLLPPKEEVDRALGMMETFLRRMMRILREESDKPL
jgi:hypothetical protein